jgi:hypothetical protein
MAEPDPLAIPDAADFALGHDQLEIIRWLFSPDTDAEEIARRLMADAPRD